MNPSMELIIVLCLGVLVVAVAAGLIMTGRKPRFHIVADPASVLVTQYQTSSVNLVLQRQQGWFGKPVEESATFIVHPPTAGVASVSPTLGVTNAVASAFTIVVTGLQQGTDSIRISATPAMHTAAIPLLLPVTVEVDPAAPARRIRHTAAGLVGSNSV